MIPTALVLQEHEKKCGDFAETTAFERYGVKQSLKANMHNQHWLTSTRFFPFSAPWTNQVKVNVAVYKDLNIEFVTFVTRTQCKNAIKPYSFHRLPPASIQHRQPGPRLPHGLLNI